MDRKGRGGGEEEERRRIGGGEEDERRTRGGREEERRDRGLCYNSVEQSDSPSPCTCSLEQTDWEAERAG